jgi:hypothetical protein
MEEVTLLHGHLESHVLACRGAGVVGRPHREDQVRTRPDLEQMALTQLLDEFDAASRIPLALTDADVLGPYPNGHDSRSLELISLLGMSISDPGRTTDRQGAEAGGRTSLVQKFI